MPNYAKLAVDSALSAFGIRSHYEQPRYRVMEYVGSVEIRAYGRRLAAEATVAAPDEGAGREQAFKILAAYIFGQNRTADGASDEGTKPSAATGPAEAKADSMGTPREIAMTTPVETRTTGAGRFAMRFFLPGELTLATAPKPLDARVGLLELPEETLAALAFGGRASQDEVGRCKRELAEALKPSAWRPTGEPVALFYDPPFTLPFLRRNEVAVPVEPAQWAEPARRAAASASA